MGHAILTGTPQADLDLLEKAVASEDSSVFARAVDQIDWSRHTPEDIIRAVYLALAVGAHGTARSLTEIGARQFPGHETVQRFARVLAPPKILRADLPPDPGAAADIRWLKEHGSEYRGRYVALKDGELLDSADSFEPLVAKYPRRSGVLITRIP